MGLLIAWCGFLVLGSSTDEGNLPPFISYTFSDIAASKVVQGNETSSCDLGQLESFEFQDIAIVTMRGNSDKCWVDGRYNSLGFQLQGGVVTTFQNAGASFNAHKIHPPTSLPTRGVVASDAHIFFKMKTKQSLSIFRFDNGILQKYIEIPEWQPTSGHFVDTGVKVSHLSAPLILVFVEGGSYVGSWPLIGQSTEGAWLAGGQGFGVSARRFLVGGHPFDPENDWKYGPGTLLGNYGMPKRFIPVRRNNGLDEGVVWQDQSLFTVQTTWFSHNLLSAETFTVSTQTGHNLVAAAYDGTDKLLLLLVSKDIPKSNQDPINVRLIKVDAFEGKVLDEKSLNTDKNGLDVHKFSEAGGSMVWNAVSGKVGVVLGRTTTKNAEGFTRQGAIFFVVDAETLSVIRRPEPTSVKSLANSIILAKSQEFISMDLGTSNPRGIHLNTFSADDQRSRSVVVYNFKTHHATAAMSPAGVSYPRYPEIDANNLQFFKWSDDDNTYTELAHSGIEEVSDGLLIFFVGERPSLDNSQTGLVLNAARNVGFVKISSSISAKDVLSNSMSPPPSTSPSPPSTTPSPPSTSPPPEIGGFYDVHGHWTPQENNGVNFLTSFDSVDSSATRLKTARLSSNAIMLFWEVWTRTEFKYAQLMVVDSTGAIVKGPWTSQFPVQLAIQDDMHVFGGRGIAYAGTKFGKIIRYEFCASDDCPDHPGTMATLTRTTTIRKAVILSTGSRKLRRCSIGAIVVLVLPSFLPVL